MEVRESYRRLDGNSREFDIRYWQEQGPEAIFRAAEGMLRDYFLIRGIDADRQRLQRAAESFSKA